MLKFTANFLGGLVLGAFLLYLYKKYSCLNEQKYQEVEFNLAGHDKQLEEGLDIIRDEF